jgi:very-short-patch-repair endonuclease
VRSINFYYLSPMDYTRKNIQFDVIFGATKVVVDQARELRQNMTESEEMLWKHLRGRRFKGYKFRRQHPADKFVLDFYCHRVKLCIEVDGGIHNDTDVSERDSNRTYELEQLGIRVKRISNEEIEENIESVLAKIEAWLMDDKKKL